ncbi:glycerate kinase [Prauserella endophytica]|uniref:Glycerate kinase n=1 Tax=Prauserella endophytica TaxID=1592324 RepID=A0ABY2RU24_9PSEU|nr:glycerate kinase [Prauserella endophytica]
MRRSTRRAPAVLVAPDKYKGCLTAADVGRHLADGLAAGGMRPRVLPLADGGDGSVDAALSAGFRLRRVAVRGHDGPDHAAPVAFDGRTAVIEVAATCGMRTLPPGVSAPLESSTYAVGQAILATLGWGVQRIVLALGGSASTDGGAGMLAALGAVFTDDRGRRIDPCGGTVGDIAHVDLSASADLSHLDLLAATDVTHVLTGAQGAAAVYGPQKGATEREVRLLDAGLENLVTVLDRAGLDARRAAATPGAGSAGGLGFAALLIGADPVPGADFFLDLLRFDEQVIGASLVVTGEGRLDTQTFAGKLPTAISRRSAPVPVVAVVGARDLTDTDLAASGFRAVYALTDLSDQDTRSDPVLAGRLLEHVGRHIAHQS